MKNKVIVLDWGFFMFSAGNACISNPTMHLQYTVLSMLIGNLKKIGVNKDDIVIIAVDFHGEDYSSWRKLYSEEYKGGRTGLPPATYEKLNVLLQQINIFSNFHVIVSNHAEADDIMAVACRYYKDKEVVLCTCDGDLHQMWNYENVKIFSPHRLSKRYKIKPDNFNVQKFILKNVNKNHNNIVNPLLSEKAFDDRLKCINLLELPIEIESQIIAELENLPEKENHLELLPYQTLKDRFMGIYNEGTESYEKSRKYYERKEKAKMKKKALKRGGTK